MADETQAPDVPPLNRESYLGDGLYASFDGWQIRLRAPHLEGFHVCCLEPDTYKTLRNWIHSFPRLAKHMGDE